MYLPIEFLSIISFVSMAMLVWACIEVGSNDAANLVNAVFGARIVDRKKATLIAGLSVILGTVFSGPVMETIRNGVFDASSLNAEAIASVFITCYIVNTVLLYAYSGFGLPVSTTATLVFALAGATLGVSQNTSAINWQTIAEVICAILTSILSTGFSAFFFQRIFRGAIRRNAQKHELVMLHGPWICGLMLVSLSWFVLVNISTIFPTLHAQKDYLVTKFSTGGFLFLLWTLMTLLTYMALAIFGKRGTAYLFHFTSITGMICLSFAFGQNDLANCAAPGIGIGLLFYEHLFENPIESIPGWILFLCGCLMFIGMNTKRAQRVTRAEINTASQHTKIRLYAPKWCIKLATKILQFRGKHENPVRRMTAQNSRSDEGKKLHYDSLRASVILSTSACIIASASSVGLPISTTYVGFASVVATGWGDRVFDDGPSELKIGRTIWVVFGWILGAMIAFTSSAIIGFIVYQGRFLGLVFSLVLNFFLKNYFKKYADIHEINYHGKKTVILGIDRNEE